MAARRERFLERAARGLSEMASEVLRNREAGVSGSQAKKGSGRARRSVARSEGIASFASGVRENMARMPAANPPPIRTPAHGIIVARLSYATAPLVGLALRVSANSVFPIRGGRPIIRFCPPISNVAASRCVRPATKPSRERSAARRNVSSPMIC